MKRILSYFYPFTKKYVSDSNGIMEITFFRGKKMLDSANTNYSYGSCEAILKFGLRNIELKGVNEILLLGLGGGGVIKTLRSSFNYKKKITAIEIDKVIIDIALHEFGLIEDRQLEIIHNDALEFVTESTAKYDLIIIDLFIDTVVPEAFYSNTFLTDIERITENNGQLIFNASVTNRNEEAMKSLEAQLKNHFHLQRHDFVEGSNTVFTGRKAAVNSGKQQIHN